MSAAPFPHPQMPPLTLTPKDEAILQAIAEYRFVTAREIIALFYSKGSQTYGRQRLSRLAGSQDVTDKDLSYDYPLYRMGFPTGRLGNQERIFCLSARGARIVEGLGRTVPWYFRPSKLTYSHSYLLHDLTRNRFVVSLTAWAKTKPNLTIDSLLAYELAKTLIPVEMSVQGKRVKVSVVPDALITITNTRLGQRVALLVEIDHNTQAKGRFKEHIASRLAFVNSPQFAFAYRDIPYRIVYATQGVTEAAAKARLQTMLKHTMELLRDRNRCEEAARFRFTTINFPTLYQDSHALFAEAVWYRPDDLKLERPVPLLTG